MPNVFICYRRDDSSDAAGRIYDRLVREFGHAQVFYDVHSLPAGKTYEDQIRNAIKTSDIFLLMIGGDWVSPRLRKKDDPIAKELHLAVGNKLPIIPVVVGRDGRIPESNELPARLVALRNWQAVRVRPDPDFHSDVDTLIAKVQSVLTNRPAGKVSSLSGLTCPGRVEGRARCGSVLERFSQPTRCLACGTEWNARNGIPWLALEGEIRQHDRWMVFGTKLFAPFWDLSVKMLDVNRPKLVADLRLGELQWQAPGRGARILEVGVSTGANLALAAKSIRSEHPAELWGADLGLAVLKQFVKKRSAVTPHKIIPVGADAHRLPFPDRHFDRVISGGCDFADWSTALSEMLRVCRPGGIVAITTMQLIDGPSSFFNAGVFAMHRLGAARGRRPPNPREFVPPECVRIRDEQLNELFWMMTLRV